VPATIHIGEALSKGAQHITNKIFGEVIIIPKKDSESIPKDIDAVVVPEVESIHNDIIGVHLTASVQLRWTILDKNGRTLYLNTFRGECIDKRLFGTTYIRVRENYEKAVEDSLIKAYTGISTGEWWRFVRKESK
jgi:hypothetical protein